MVHVPSFKDYVALMYHEARNVRHLIRDGHFPTDGWDVITSLPNNREFAWCDVDRLSASLSNDAASVLAGFEARFGKSLEELVDMFEDPNWRHARQYGGNAWARIGRKVCRLAEALIAGDRNATTLIKRDLQMENHNTGTVQSKLDELRSVKQ